jgi:membrane-associated phospholipid phosphatase
MSETGAAASRPYRTHQPLLSDHRRSLVYGALVVVGLIAMMLAVGHTPAVRPLQTNLAVVGRTDGSVYRWVITIRGGFLTAIFKVFDFIGQGLVTIPLRIVLLAILLWRRRFGAASAFALTWLVSEVALNVMKFGFARTRPPIPLVVTVGYSFPSGHATAAAAIAVSTVLAFMPAGHRRRAWILLAVLFSFVMGFSRVYLGAHWFSDVVTGVLVGASSAVLSFGVVDEVRNLALPRIHARR